jgi:hypothetical protein
MGTIEDTWVIEGKTMRRAADIKPASLLRSGQRINLRQPKRQNHDAKDHFRELMPSPCPRKSGFAICARKV